MSDGGKGDAMRPTDRAAFDAGIERTFGAKKPWYVRRDEEQSAAVPGPGKCVTLPWPPKELSPNARLHFMQVARVKKTYRETCRLLALAAGAKSLASADRLHVELTFYPPDRRPRDQDNMLAAMKSGLDGLSDAIGLDDRKFKTTFQVADQIGGMVKVQITEAA